MRSGWLAGAAVAIATATAVSRVASARPASSGFFAEGGLGGLGYLGSAKDDSAIGPAIDLRIGYELFSWLALGVMLDASNHEATLPPPPTGQYYQLYRGAGDLRLGGLIGPIGLFAEGGIGTALISSNVLEQVGITKPGQHFGLELHAGGGVEYQLENRHYAVGVAGDYVMLPSFSSEAAVEIRVDLRYTY